MKRFSVFLLVFLFAMSACASSTSGVYVDDKNSVSFEYPENLQVREDAKNNAVLFASNFDYLDGLSESSASAEPDGSLVYQVIQNPNGLTLQEYFDADYKDCVAKLVPTDAIFEPCWETDFTKFSTFKIGDYTAYNSGWKGIPESGEMVKTLYIDANDKKLIFMLSAYKTGVTNEQTIEATAEKAFSSFKFN